MALRSLVLLLVVATIAGGGCAWRQDSAQIGFAKGSYRQILERQQRGLPVEEHRLRTLPAMTAEEYERLGDHYIRQGNVTLGFAQYDRALRMDPARVGLAYKVGLLFLKKGFTEEASKQFQAILDHDPANALAHAGMGQVHLITGEPVAAAAEFRQALAADPSLWKAHNLLGILYDRQGRHQEAVAHYQAALDLKPNEPALHNNLGMSYYLGGRYDLAVRAFQQAVQSGATELRIHNNLALALAKLQRFHEGLLAFQHGGNEARALNNLGMLYLEAGKPYNAAYYFEKSIHASPIYYQRAHENLKRARLMLAEWRSAKEQGARSVGRPSHAGIVFKTSAIPPNTPHSSVQRLAR